MEIDLELPARVDEKLDSVTATTDANAVLEGGENVDGIGDFMDDDSISLADKGIISYEPRKDLEFETKEAAYSFYREYARSVGFGITIKASRRSKKSGKFIDVKIVCSRFGTKRDSDKAVNSRSCPKTDCKAGMHIKRKQDGKWYIYSFVKEHNHEICPDDFYYAIRGRIKQSINAVHQKKGLQLALDGEDIQAMLDNFMLMQGETPGFYYAVDFDKEKRMRNVCWVDAKGRHDYGYFSDVIFFDTTYIRKKYKVPLLPIVGVNHNYQLLLLGCGLIGDETSSTYIWLMRTWLRAVGGQSPKVVITDDNTSLQEAIDDVFPDARHCFCLWHVMEKISHHLSHKMHNFEVFLRKFNKCVYQPWSEECFEKRWSDKIVDAFELREEECMGFLFESRKKWVPAYMRGTFLGGFCTVERSEGISSFFDNYIHKETTFKEFIDHYKTFLHDCYEEETKADFETKYKQPTIKSVFPYEKQMSTVYTHAVFKKFQSEVHGMGSCDVQKEGEDGKTMLYWVDDSEKQQKFIVAWIERQSSVYCSCHLKIDPLAPLKEMTLLSCGVSTGLGAVWNTADVQAGETVAVFGLGAVGLAVVEGARARGASRIIGVDINAEKCIKGKAIGITDFINPKELDKPIHEKIREMTEGGVHYSFECAGNLDVLREAFLSTSDGWGLTVILGIHPSPRLLPLHPMELFDGRRMVASVFGDFKGKSQLPLFAKQCMAGEVKLDEFITHEMPFSRINEAFQLLVHGKSLRCLLHF